MKQTIPTLFAVSLAASGLVAPAIAQDHGHEAESHGESHGHAVSPLEQVTELIAVMQPANDSKVSGTVLFEQADGAVKVTAKIGGLSPNSKHAIHVHDLGDITAADGTSAGGHYNPEGHDHGLPHSEVRHAGDFGNLETDGDGNATLVLMVDNITLTGAKNPVIGRAMIIHAKEDDGGQPTGNAGDRIAMGVIGVAKVAMPEGH